MKVKKTICLNCMDGHIQLPVINWIKEKHTVDYVDMITAPGIVSILSNNKKSIENIKAKIKQSLEYGCERKLFIVGHADCDLHTGNNTEQRSQLESAMTRMKKNFPELVIYGLWFQTKDTVEVFNDLQESK